MEFSISIPNRTRFDLLRDLHDTDAVFERGRRPTTALYIIEKASIRSKIPIVDKCIVAGDGVVYHDRVSRSVNGMNRKRAFIVGSVVLLHADVYRTVVHVELVSLYRVSGVRQKVQVCPASAVVDDLGVPVGRSLRIVVFDPYHPNRCRTTEQGVEKRDRMDSRLGDEMLIVPTAT